jgi:hypothetical protein
MAQPDPDDGKNEQATAAGCLLIVVCLAAIGGMAFYLLTWRDPETGLALPQKVVIFVPLLAGAVCYGIGAAILQVLGLPVLRQPEKESDDPPHDSEENQTRDH